jgi:hypothetical protein
MPIWLDRRLIDPEEYGSFVDAIPPHCLAAVSRRRT